MINSVNGGIADIRNIAQCYDAVMRTLQRNPNLAGLACFYGPSGFGKSFAANYVANIYSELDEKHQKRFKQNLFRAIIEFI
ncbi:hypothetical protein [Acinetobacter tjernbergiae]|uniref:Uncharacterized protein n=1 Tax=Acinetobacter tjernbergiae DSM 14971 = CIP 107465 TaxID=1120928 RepID=V2UVI3_9GAMM|nr:hypothetical protein [Acinetobacter tjernbergiae]ESK54012.1 hypothetical protein F990_03057 [Acinetobacter tjernbergiae DSM 14971 = CIP 107465]